MKAKVAFKEDIRRWHYPNEDRYENLTTFVENTFHLRREKNNDEYYLQFEDGEKDKVTIANEQDLLDAFECAQQEKRPSLKIFVTAGSVNGTQQLSSCNDIKKEEDNDDFDDATHSEMEKRDWQEVLLELVLDEGVKRLLPELIWKVTSLLLQRKECGEEVSLVAVVPPLLEKEKEALKSIVEHELYQKYLQSVLPMLLEKASCFTHILLTLRDKEAVEKWVADMLQLVSVSFAKGKDDGLWKMHLDMWCDEEMNGGEAIHYQVQCNKCNVVPIRGIRYKCAVCEDFDLCAKCESSGQHYVGHPLVKINRPVCGRTIEKGYYCGLREMEGKKKRKKDYHRKQKKGSHPCWIRDSYQHMFEGGQGHEETLEENSLSSKKKKSKSKCKSKKNKEKNETMEKKQKKEKKPSKKDRKEKKEEKLKKKKKLRSERNKKEKSLEELPNMQSNLLNECEIEVEPKVEEMISSTEMKCSCGSTLVKKCLLMGTNEQEYRPVTCTLCQKDCSQDSFFFGCPIENNLTHPEGLDVCSKCVCNEEVVDVLNVQVEEEEEQEEEEQQQEQGQEQVENANEIEKEVEVIPSVEIDESVQFGVSMIMNMEKVWEVEDPFSDFAFAKEARSLVEMGFQDHERIKFLLVNKNGDLSQVIVALLS